MNQTDFPDPIQWWIHSPGLASTIELILDTFFNIWNALHIIIAKSLRSAFLIPTQASAPKEIMTIVFLRKSSSQIFTMLQASNSTPSSFF